jgi:hypothetical protein
MGHTLPFIPTLAEVTPAPVAAFPTCLFEEAHANSELAFVYVLKIFFL